MSESEEGEPPAIDVRRGLEPLVMHEASAASAAGCAEAAKTIFTWLAAHGESLSHEQRMHTANKARAFCVSAVLHADDMLDQLVEDEEQGEESKAESAEEEVDGGDEA